MDLNKKTNQTWISISSTFFLDVIKPKFVVVNIALSPNYLGFCIRGRRMSKDREVG